MGIFERFGIMRSILTVECVGWFGTKEYLSVIFRNIRRSIRKINHLKVRAHFSIHGDCHRSGLCRIGVSHTASNRNFTAQSGSSQAMTSSRWPSGDLQVTSRWPSGDGVGNLWQLGRLVPAVQRRWLVVRHRGAHLQMFSWRNIVDKCKASMENKICGLCV